MMLRWTEIPDRRGIEGSRRRLLLYSTQRSLVKVSLGGCFNKLLAKNCDVCRIQEMTSAGRFSPYDVNCCQSSPKMSSKGIF